MLERVGNRLASCPLHLRWSLVLTLKFNYALPFISFIGMWCRYDKTKVEPLIIWLLNISTEYLNHAIISVFPAFQRGKLSGCASFPSPWKSTPVAVMQKSAPRVDYHAELMSLLKTGGCDSPSVYCFLPSFGRRMLTLTHHFSRGT